MLAQKNIWQDKIYKISERKYSATFSGRSFVPLVIHHIIIPVKLHVMWLIRKSCGTSLFFNIEF
ncbi:hypothetical protein HMPREF9554_03023 [Treponema phagedenis F0421]|nr:hypothetical protein HMPREF9554_03023 [Treponema phagedenis F0421]